MLDASTPEAPAVCLDVTDPRAQEAVRYTGLSSEDLAAVRHAQDVAQIDVAAVAGRFYDHVLAQPELRAIIEGRSSVERHTQALAAYFASIWTGVYDDRVAAGRIKVGKVHDHIDLPLSAFLGGVVTVDDVVIRALIDAFGEDPDALHAAIMGYRRLVQTDVALINEAFIEAREEERERLHANIASASHEVAAQTDSATGSVAECVEAARLGAESVARAGEAIESMRSAVEDVQHQLAELSGHIERTTGVVGEIYDISEQTRLLALNARIEAAHAGEHGRGFAVVADEVGQLAERTRQSLASISSLSKDSQGAIAAVTGALAQSISEVERVEGQAGETRANFERATEAVNIVSAQLEEIAAGMRRLVESTVSGASH